MKEREQKKEKIERRRMKIEKGERKVGKNRKVKRRKERSTASITND